MRIAITGGTGFLGGPLVDRLLARGDEVKLLSRRPARHAPHPRLSFGHFDAYAPMEPGVVAGVDAVIHLAGEPVSERWTPQHKERVMRSRVQGTSTIAHAVAAAGVPTLLSASAIGYYGHRGDEPLDESAPPAGDFLSRVCRAWEASADPAREAGVRVVHPRMGLVLGRGGGALEKMLLPFKLGAGGRIGSGKQVWSWIHLEDVLSLLLLALDRREVSGALNVTSPGAVRQAEFARELGHALHRPAAVPTPAFALRLALGEMADAVLTGQRVVPKKALELGYRFAFPGLRGALADVVGER